MSIVETLKGLGYVPVNVFTDEGDFVLQDDSDGIGPYVKEWRSKDTCPFPVGKPEPAAEPEG